MSKLQTRHKNLGTDITQLSGVIEIIIPKNIQSLEYCLSLTRSMPALGDLTGKGSKMN